MPRNRPNRRDYVTIQLQRMIGKKSSKPALVPGDELQNNVPPELPPKSEEDKSTKPKPFRPPSIPSASVAEQPDKWRRGKLGESGNTSSIEITVLPPDPADATGTPALPPLPTQTGTAHHEHVEQVHHSASRYICSASYVNCFSYTL